MIPTRNHKIGRNHWSRNIVWAGFKPCRIYAIALLVVKVVDELCLYLGKRLFLAIAWKRSLIHRSHQYYLPFLGGIVLPNCDFQIPRNKTYSWKKFPFFRCNSGRVIFGHLSVYFYNTNTCLFIYKGSIFVGWIYRRTVIRPHFVICNVFARHQIRYQKRFIRIVLIN